MINHFRKKISLWEGSTMEALKIFDLPWSTGLKDLKSGRPPIAGPSPIPKTSIESV
jgi:hypothetical protein